MRLQNIHPQYVTNEKGNKTAVLLSIEEFNTLIEDLEDLAIVAKRVNEDTTSHKDFLNELKQDGLL